MPRRPLTRDETWLSNLIWRGFVANVHNTQLQLNRTIVSRQHADAVLASGMLAEEHKIFPALSELCCRVQCMAVNSFFPALLLRNLSSFTVMWLSSKDLSDHDTNILDYLKSKAASGFCIWYSLSSSSPGIPRSF